MSKKNLKLLLALVVIILMVVLSYFYLGNKPTTGVVKDTTGGDNFFADLLNFANFSKPNDTDTGNDQSNGQEGENTNGQVIEPTKLVKISSMPIAGYTVFDQERFVDVAAPKKEEVVVEEAGSKTPQAKINTRPVAPATELIPVLRYVSKENGNIFQTFVDKLNERKFSDNLIPGVHEAFFGNNGESVILRYLKEPSDTILTWSGTLPKEVIGADSSRPNKLLGHFLLDNITDMTISPDTRKIFYIFNSQNGAIGVSAAPEGDKRVQVYSGAYTEWLSQWPADGVITLTTKPSAGVPGYMYQIETARNNFVKVLGGINGLTTLTSPDKENVLYGDNLLSLSVYDINKKETKNLSVRTLPEKCVWGRGSIVYCAVPKFINGSYSYPDSWYQGEVSFSDDIWKIDVSTGTSELILDPIKDGGGRNFEPLDAIRLSLSSDNKHLFFINKNDPYLWGLELN